MIDKETEAQSDMGRITQPIKKKNKPKPGFLLNSVLFPLLYPWKSALMIFFRSNILWFTRYDMIYLLYGHTMES